MRSSLTPEQEREIRATYERERIAGHVIAQRMGVSRSAVYRSLARAGIARTTAESLVSPTPEQEKEIRKLYEEQQLSVNEIGVRIGIGRGSVASSLVRQGVVRRTREERSRLFTKGSINSDGYVLVPVWPGDPYYEMGHRSNGTVRRVAEHRLVVARRLGRCLDRHETVHHKNGDRQDNRIENLQMLAGNHGNGQAAECRSCGSHDIVFVAIEAAA